MINKRGQEEAVGFVAIIVVVAIATVFFIGISIRDQPSEAIKSVEIKQFLETSDKYTSDCSISYSDRFASLGDLVRECYQNPNLQCFDGRSVCEVYNSTIQNIILKSFAIGQEYAIKGYLFNLTYSAQSKQTQIISLYKGECLGSYKSEELLKPDAPGKGTFVSTLGLCS